MDVNQKMLLVVRKFDTILRNFKIIFFFLFSLVIVEIHRNIVRKIMDVYQTVGIIQPHCFIIVLLFGKRFIFFLFIKKKVCLRYRPEVTQAQIDSVTKAYLDVEKKAIRNGTTYVKIVGGRTIHTEGVQDNFRNGFILTFNNNDGEI
jgi:hypothetical protein